MNKPLIYIGEYNGIPIAYDPVTQELLEYSEALGSIFSSIGQAIGKTAGKIGNSVKKVGSSGFFKSIGKAFDPDTAVGGVINQTLRHYAQGLANRTNGGLILPTHNGQPLPPGFNPAQNPQYIVAPAQQPPAKNNNTLLIVGGAGLLVVGAIVIASINRKSA